MIIITEAPLTTSKHIKEAASIIKGYAAQDTMTGDRVRFKCGPTIYSCLNQRESILNLADKLIKKAGSCFTVKTPFKAKVSMGKGSYNPDNFEGAELIEYARLMGKDIALISTKEGAIEVPVNKSIKPEMLGFPPCEHEFFINKTADGNHKAITHKASGKSLLAKSLPISDAKLLSEAIAVIARTGIDKTIGIINNAQPIAA